MQLLTFAISSAALVGGVSASLYPGQSNLNHTCQFTTPSLSCSAQAYPNITDSCCVETYGGLVLSTQFWDTYTGLESKGQVLPANTWTLHGLWPDFCNGSFTQYCDLNRQYDPVPSPNTTTGKPDGTPVPAYKGPDIGTFLAPFGKFDLLAFMNKYWISQGSPNADFWGHEFSKHGTCFSTFDIPCYGPQYRKNEDVVDFFTAAVTYYQNLPTYGWLSAKNIRPSNSTTYSLTDMQAALSAGFGAVPYIGCSGPRYNTTTAGAGTMDRGFTQISEVWYYHHVYGRVQHGQALPVSAAINGGSISNCATTPGAIKYPNRAPGSEA